MRKHSPFTLPKALYLRDPEGTLLGRSIVSGAITLLDQDGFENLTFRRLAQEVPTTEASLYRYFEDKYQLLRYLVAWYWEWLNYRLELDISSLAPPRAQFRQVLDMLANSARYDPSFAHVDEAALCRIVIRESPKIYLTGSTAAENQFFFQAYEKLCLRISAIVLSIRPGYPQALSLVSTLIETAHRQILFAQNLPMLTNLRIRDGDFREIADFLESMALAMLNVKKSPGH